MQLSHELLEQYREKEVPWSPLGYITYKRTYARPLDGRTEEWCETVFRCVNALLDMGMSMTLEEAELMYDYVFNLKCSFGGRSLWQLGTGTVEKLGADSLQNCWHVAIDRVDAFTFLFNELMLGGGVAFNVEPQFVYGLPKVRSLTKNITHVDDNDCDFIVPDNREGWVELLKRIVDAYFVTGVGFEYNTKCVRGRGEPISTFGGTASGPAELVSNCQKITKVFNNRLGEKLSPVDCVDVCNLIGAIVVSGNVRRSAQLALCVPNDLEFLGAKRWDKSDVPNHRSMSNNSIATDTVEGLPDEFWETYEVAGEPLGLVNLTNCRRYGRTSDPIDYRPDYKVVGVNPCAEITLESFEACNLAEIFLPNCTKAEFAQAAKFMYKATKTVSGIKFIDYRTNEIVSRNRRLGIGITGYFSSEFVGDAGTFGHVYRELEELDRVYSEEQGIPESIKLTTVKPSGTLSLLPDRCTPGVHPAFGKYLIRRIRMSADLPLVETCGLAGYRVEPERFPDGTKNATRVVVSFPFTYGDAVTADQLTAIDQLEATMFLQEMWADNSVSNTIYFQKEELPEIREWLSKHYTDRVKAISFCQHSEHGFDQAPFEEITKEEYDQFVSEVTPINRIEGSTYEQHPDADCEDGSCPVR